MSTALTPGTRFPDFTLRDDSGHPHRLSTLQGDDLVVLMLGRGEHCPRERQHQREMLKFYEWSHVAFTKLVTILPNDLHDTSRLRSSKPSIAGMRTSSKARSGGKVAARCSASGGVAAQWTS